MKVSYGKASIPNKKKTSAGTLAQNEDRVVLDQRRNVFGVFDGHGGAMCVKFLEQHAVDAVVSALVSRNILPEPEAELDDDAIPEEKGLKNKDELFGLTASAFLESFSALEAGFKVVYEATGSTSGACGLMAFILNQTCYVAHCGDCRLVYKPMEGKRKFFKSKKRYTEVQVTTDHRVSDNGEERDRVEEEGGVIRNGRIGTLSPSRTFGDWDVKSGMGEDIVTALPDVNAFSIAEGPMLIVVATDGVWDTMPNKKVFEIVEKSLKANPGDLASAALNLVDIASRTTKDDVSALIIVTEPLN